MVLGYHKATYKATGAPLNAQFAHIWRLRDVRITAFQQYTYTAQAARAMHGWRTAKTREEARDAGTHPT